MRGPRTARDGHSLVLLTRRRFAREFLAPAVMLPLLSACGGTGTAPGAVRSKIPSAESANLAARRHEVNGLSIYSLASNSQPPGAPTIVLVHGLALSGRYMIPTAGQLAGRAEVHIPDFPGFGDSDKPEEILDVPGLADALAAWLHVALGRPVALVGNSFACQIIIDLASRYPDLLIAAVLQGPTTPPKERTWLDQFIRWRQNAKYNPPETGEIASEDYKKCGYRRALKTFHYSLVDRPEDKLHRIGAPSLVVRGELDPICRPEWAAQVARGLPDGELVVIPGVAHTLC
jgi:2-hydroxy-6-oxonona-2,4-dienedioate hydrolase